MRRLKQLTFLAVAACTFAGTIAPQLASAQTAPAAAAPDPVFDAAAKSQAIAAATKLLTDNYVFPDVGAEAAALLTQNLAAGKYDAIATPADFAAQLTIDLQALTHDKHLNVFSLGQPLPGAPMGPPPPMGFYGFAKVDRLKGNIGYIVLNRFPPKDLSKLGADKAMALVASTDALIIDLRTNYGGDPHSVAYLDSFFFDGKSPVHLDDILHRKPGTTDFDREAYFTEPTPVSYAGKPVYLITSHDTFSGGEGFAYELQAQKRAMVVGEVTAGGAHPVEIHPIAPGLGLMVPVARSENPVTHSNWEGKGVQPDIAVSADQGFAAAYGAAVRALGHSAPESVDAVETVTEAHLLIPRTTPLPGSETALRRWEAGMAEGQPPYDILSDNAAKDAKAFLPFFQAQLSPRGALQSLTFVEIDETGADVFDAVFADKSSLRFSITLEPDGKIASCIFGPH